MLIQQGGLCAVASKQSFQKTKNFSMLNSSEVDDMSLQQQVCGVGFGPTEPAAGSCRWELAATRRQFGCHWCADVIESIGSYKELLAMHRVQLLSVSNSGGPPGGMAAMPLRVPLDFTMADNELGTLSSCQASKTKPSSSPSSWLSCLANCAVHVSCLAGLLVSPAC